MKPEEYINNPVLQLWATYCIKATKNDIIKMSKAMGVKIKSAAPFITPFEKEGIITHEEGTTIPHYSIAPKPWLEIIKAMDTPTFLRLKKMPKVFIFSFHQTENTLAETVHALLHNLPFDKPLGELKKDIYSHFGHVFWLKQLLDLRNEEILTPMLKQLDRFWYDQFIERYTDDLIYLHQTDSSVKIMHEVIINNPSVPEEKKMMLKGKIGIYDEFIRKGNIKEGANMAKDDIRLSKCYEAVAHLQNGDYNKAFKLFVDSLKGTQRKLFGIEIFDFYYTVAMVNSSLSSATVKMEALLKSEDLEYSIIPVIKNILEIAKGKKSTISASYAYAGCYTPTAKALTLLVMEHYHIDTRIVRKEWVEKVMQIPAVLLKMELSDVLPELQEEKETLRSITGMHPSLPTFEERPEWDIRLDELLNLHRNADGRTKSSTSKAKSQSRIIYLVNRDFDNITPVLQKSKDGINWTAGRNVSLEKFSKGQTEGMQAEDHAVASCVKGYSYGWYGGVEYELTGVKAIAALVGNPLVFDAKTRQHIDVVMEKPQLIVTLKGNVYNITTDIDINKTDGGYCIVDQQGQSIKVVKIDNTLKRTIQALEEVSIPKEATKKLTLLLESLSNTMIVMSDLLKNSENISSKKSHPETIVQLQPAEDTIRCSLMVRPFGDTPPVCKPGKGMQIISTAIKGKQVQTKRNLTKEKVNYEAVKALMLNYDEDNYQDNTWMLQPEECLELLDQLRGMSEHCVIEWPEGERFRVSYAPLQPSSFHLSINSAASWFELKGEVAISDNTKIKIAELMDKLAEAKGKFIKVGDEEYVKISNELRQHIETIARMASRNRNAMRISRFNAPQLERMVESGMEVKTDQTYTTLINRIKEAQEADIKIPKHIQADLRSYQKEGYIWMSRLASWGAGALLADDMGLGKTVQTITLLLSRAKEGPQLVIVPTSLILNWKEEAARFAPSLNILLLNRAGEDRKRMIEEAKAFDVVISTYGLLITEEELLCSRTWHTIVLDEAHTIKNKDTKMSKVAMQLEGDFRLLLTGTPLQNHVSELWNLMQFANPHLLGTFQEFTDRFLLPIERDHNRERQKLLKRLVTPFILRRTKNDVLNELPEKTEITLRVDLSEEEWAFYDNIRQKALANMEDNTATAMQALAEITRLRQAACNARLVEKKMNIESSKLNTFMQLTDNLHSNHHRALVFSQFTSHLALVKEELDKRGIEYLYLDGATSAKERIRLVEEFQHGDMSLFLISLKAGGLGLNLTAADYVIHLDPWWNPAIEDQASDRAYRIGQQKPVTVYRIIAANTIEEKIIDLHQTKKNMADALLDGGDISASMSREEMIELLKEL